MSGELKKQTSQEVLNGLLSTPSKEYDKDKVRDDAGSTSRQIAAAIVASLGCCSCGVTISYSGVALPSMQKQNELAISVNLAAWIASVISIGAIIGSISSGPIMNRFGRRICLLFLLTLNLAGWCLIILGLPVFKTFGPRKAAFTIIAGRFLTGIAFGIGLAVGPVYISESITPQLKKSLGAMSQASIVTMALCTVVLGSFLDWFKLAIACAAMMPPAILSVIYLPESPVWLAAIKQDLASAENSIMLLRGPGYDSTEEIKLLKHEIRRQSIHTATTEVDSDELHADVAQSGTSPKVLLTRGVRKPMATALGIMFFQQFSAVDILIFVYSIEIYDNIDERVNPYLLSTIIQVFNLICCFISMVIVRWFNAKTILVISAVLMFLSQIGLGTFFYLKEAQVEVDLLWLPLISLFTFVFAFGAGYGPFGLSVSAEILPIHAKDWGNSVNITFMGMCAFFIGNTFYDLKSLLSLSGLMYFYGTITGFCIVFTVLCVPRIKVTL